MNHNQTDTVTHPDVETVIVTESQREAWLRAVTVRLGEVVNLGEVWERVSPEYAAWHKQCEEL